MQDRENALKEWLNRVLNHAQYIVTPLAGDASFRRYFRIKYNGLNRIVMDAPPGKEDLEPFIHVAQVLSQAQIIAPEIFAIDKTQGFLLLSDFGDQLLLNHLNKETASHYYQLAMDTLLQIQNCPIDSNLPSFDKTHMLKEMNLCSEWFFSAYLKITLNNNEQDIMQKAMSWIADEVSIQPTVFIHRDYHSRNLMIVEHDELGVIDFQDAMKGPMGYDLASLLKDCYISWPREQTIAWVSYFYQNSVVAKTNYTLPEFIRAFDLVGVQRHLKVLGIFCRLYLRDQKSGYLRDLPLTLQYVLECCEIYEELHPLFHLFQQKAYLP